MSQIKKKAFQVLVIISCLTILGTSYYLIKTSIDQKNRTKKIQQELKEELIRDWDYQYAKLKYEARNWSSIYAQITLIENRDTVAYDNYTVSDFSRKHSRVIQFWDRIQGDPFIKNYQVLDPQLNKIFPYGDSLRQLNNTYKNRMKLSEYITSLHASFNDIVNHTKETDSIIKHQTIREDTFTTYFYYLSKLDRTYYDLLFEDYPKSLYYLVSGDKKLEKEAVSRLIYRQTQELTYVRDHDSSSAMGKFRAYMNTYLKTDTDSLDNYVVKKNDSKLLVLVKTLQFKETDAITLRTDYLQALIDGASLLKDQHTKEVYVYLEFFDPENFYTDIWIQTPNQQYDKVEYPDDISRMLSDFYNIDAYQYHIKGSFSVLDAWYPKLKQE